MSINNSGKAKRFGKALGIGTSKGLRFAGRKTKKYGKKLRVHGLKRSIERKKRKLRFLEME